jgi:hypothetical protein
MPPVRHSGRHNHHDKPANYKQQACEAMRLVPRPGQPARRSHKLQAPFADAPSEIAEVVSRSLAADLEES